MKIAVLAHFAPPRHCAGAEMMLLSMLRPLVERGHEVRWQLSRPTADEAPYDLHGITVIPRQADHQGLVDQIIWADIVIAHLENMPNATTLSRHLARPFVHVMHNDHPMSKAWSVSDAAAIVVNSQWMADSFGNPANCLIVRPPVIADDYLTDPGRKITLVNLNENKGGHLFERLALRMPDVQFLGVVGAYGRQVIPNLPNMEIRQHTTDMRSVYADTRVLLMPSEYESWGRVGVEAMWSGVPVIASPTPGLVESLGSAGTFCDRDDLDGWVFEIRRLLRGEHWQTASRAASARALELDMTDDVGRWVTFVESIGATVEGRCAA